MNANAFTAREEIQPGQQIETKEVSRRRRGNVRFLKSVAFANKSVTKQALLQHFSR